MANEAKIRLSVDTSSAQKDVKILDKQIQELGGGGQINLDSGITDLVKNLTTSQQKLIDSMQKYMESTERNTRAILSKLENLKTATNKALQDDANNVYQQKLKELEAKKKMMETGLVPVSSSGGGGGGNGTGGNVPALPGSSGGNNGGKLLDAINKLGVAATALGAIRSVWGYASSGAKSSQVSELRTYQIYNTSGYYDKDFSAGRNSIADSGAKYGYNVGETLSVQDTLMGMMGTSTKDKSQADSNTILSTARALGVDENSLAYGAGLSYQKGTYSAGDMGRYANLFASSVKAAGMTGREDEQLEVLQSIQELLGKNLTSISENQMTSALGLYSMLASSNDALKGSAGAEAVNSLDDMIKSSSNSMDILLGKGMGRFSSGVSGLMELERAKAAGITDPENLKWIVKDFEAFYGEGSFNSDLGSYLLTTNGIKPEVADEIVKHRDELLSGNYSDSLEKLLESDSGTNLIDKELKDYNEDTALSEGMQYKVETENAQDRIGDLLNENTGWLKAIYNKLPNWAQSGLGLGGQILGGAAQGYGAYKIFDLIKGVFGGGSSGSSGAGGFFSTLFGKGASKSGSAGGFFSKLFGKFGKGASSSADDVIDASYKIFDDSGNVVEEFTAGAGKSGKILSKLGKAAKIAPYVFRGIEGISDFISADDGVEQAEAVGGTAGGMGGIWGGTALGAKGGAAIGTLIAPGLGTAIGGGIGALLGAIGGDKLGSWIGEEIFGSIAEDWSDAKTNYGTGLASLPIIGGLWRKDGTLIQQQIKEEEASEAKKRGGLPSDYGMPEVFDSVLNDNGSDINWSGLKTPLTSENKYYRQQMENKYGLTAEDLDKWMKSDEYKNWQEAIGGNGYTGRNSDLNKNTDSQTQLKQSIDELNETIQDANGGKSSSAPTASEGKQSEFVAANSVRDSASKGDGTYITAPSGDTEYVSSNSTSSAKKGGGGILGFFKNLFGLHATGKDYVPYDGYLAELHKGEAVLTAHEADQWRKSSLQDAMKPEIAESMNLPNALATSTASEGTLNIVLSGKIDGMTESNQSDIVRAVVNIIQSATGTNAIMNQLSNNFVRFQN